MNLNLLWMSNAPFCPSGYGVVSANVCYRLKKWHTVDFLAYYGLEGAAIKFEGIWIFPSMDHKFGADAAALCIANLKPDIFISLFDVWVGPGWLDKLHRKWLAYVPVDHKPCPPPIRDILKNCYMPIAMSKFGQIELDKAGIKSVYIPHGVDTQVYKPLPEKEKYRKKLNFKPDEFIVGQVGANVGDRKDQSRFLLAFKRFLDNNPDAHEAKAYMHTSMWTSPHGHDILGKIDILGLRGKIHHTHRWNMYRGLLSTEMAEVYNAFDVFVNCSHGEGFGIPILEAQACGVPAVVTDFTSMTELVQGHGWLVDPVKTSKGNPSYDMTPLNSYQALPDEDQMADAISDAYNHPDKRLDYAKKSSEFAKGYDYDLQIIPMWLKLLEEIETDTELKPNVMIRGAKK